MNNLPIKFGKKTADSHVGFPRTCVCACCKLGASFPLHKPRLASLLLFLGLAPLCWSSSLAQDSSESAGKGAAAASTQPAKDGIITHLLSLPGDCDVENQSCLNIGAAFSGPGVLKAELDSDFYDIKHADEHGSVVLHWAAMFNDAEVVDLLIENGADIEVHDADGNTPLHLASVLGNNETVLALAEQGADLSARNEQGYAPLHLAALFDNPDIILALVGKGADIEARSDLDETPLHVAAENYSHRALAALIDKGASVDAYSNGGSRGHRGTPLLYAAVNNNTEAIQALLGIGADINAKTESGATALLMAASVNSRDAVELLVDRGADTDKVVFSAVTDGGPETLQMLIEKGIVGEAEANSRLADEGYMPLHRAALLFWRATGATVQTLIDIGADTEARIVEEYETQYLKPVYKDQINGRIRRTASFDSEDLFLFDGYRHPTTYGFTPLHFAASNQNAEPLNVLIGNGVDVDALAKFSGTPLHIAVAFGKTDNVRDLLNAGASLSATDKFGNLPIHLAAREEGAEVMGILLETGADIEAKAANGYTALQYAAWRGDPDVFAVLLEAGARTDVVTVDGQTIMDLANGNERLRGTPAMELVPKSLMEHASDIFHRLVQVFFPTFLSG